MKISICVPVYEMNGRGVEYLSQLVGTIEQQTFKDYEIVISDHSSGDEIEKYCRGKDKILYLRNEYKVGSSSSNINNAIRHASGDIIKIMFQDDFLFSDNILELISKTTSKWGSIGFAHCNGDEKNKIFRPLIPYIHENIQEGVNTIGAPSVIFMREKNYFDENLIWLMDCEFYKRMYESYGKPEIIKEIGVIIRIGGHTISSRCTEELKERELVYVREKCSKSKS